MEQFWITIGRQYGSGGREIGEKVAKALSIPCYDKNITKLASERLGIAPEHLKEVDEYATPSFLYSIAMGSIGAGPFSFGIPYDTPINDKLFNAQADIIKEEAQKGSCLFVGRCADYVLEGKPRLLRIFLYADLENRIERVMKRRNVSYEEAKNKIIKTDKRRANYYNYYTSQKWGRIENYDLLIDTGKLGVDATVDLICQVVQKNK